MSSISIQECKPLKLHPLEFKGSLSADEITNIGKCYINDVIAKKDRCGDPVPCCRSDNGKWVYFRSSVSKLQGREGDDGERPAETSRVRRLHWIVPIVEGKTAETVCVKEFLGKTINQRCIGGATYRIYFVPSKMYCVWLIKGLTKKQKNSYNLISAYRIEDESTAKLFARLFPKP